MVVVRRSVKQALLAAAWSLPGLELVARAIDDHRLHQGSLLVVQRDVYLHTGSTGDGKYSVPLAAESLC